MLRVRSVKWYAHQKRDQTIRVLKTAADEALSEKACDLALIRQYSRTAWRWVGAYQKGLGSRSATGL